MAPALERDPDFDEILDAEGAIDIRGRIFARSEVLASDPVAYREALAEYRDDKKRELFETVTQRFPSPIAHCLYRFLHSHETETERLLFLKDTWEAVIAIVFAMAVAEVRSRGQIISVTTDKVRDFKRHLDSQNLRDRLEVVRVVLASEVSVPLLRDTVPMSAVRVLIDLNERRNQDIAHRATPDERRAIALVEEFEPKVVSLLEDLAQFETVEVVRYVGPGKKRGEGTFETFVGHGSTRTISARALSDRVTAAIGGRSKEEVLLLRADDMIPLSPMIVMRASRGHRSELAFMKKRRAESETSAFTFESFGVAAEFESDSSDLALDLDAVKACFTQGNHT